MKDLTWLKTALIAHRGFHSKDGTIPENSMLAYQEAMSRGYAIELDVNILKDGSVVCFHDHTLKRMCHDERSLSDVIYDDIKNLKLLSSHEKITLLKDVLDKVSGQVPLLIELKPHGNVVELSRAVIHVLKDYQGQYAIFSFHPRVVYYFKKHAPHMIRGQISESFSENINMPKMMKWLMKHMIFNPLTKPDFISYGIKDLPNKTCDKLKRKGITIISYAARDQKGFDFVKKNYDNVVFEYFVPKNRVHSK